MKYGLQSKMATVPEVFALAKEEVTDLHEDMHDLQDHLSHKIDRESDPYVAASDAVQLLESVLQYLEEVKSVTRLKKQTLGYQEQAEKKMTKPIRRDNAVRKLKAVAYAFNMGSTSSNGYRMSVEAAIGELEMIKFE